MVEVHNAFQGYDPVRMKSSQLQDEICILTLSFVFIVLTTQVHGNNNNNNNRQCVLPAGRVFVLQIHPSEVPEMRGILCMYVC